IVGGESDHLAARRVSEQDADFFEGLPNGADPVPERIAVARDAEDSRRFRRRESAAERLDIGWRVIPADLAAREHVVTAREAALRMSLEQERLDAIRRSVAKQHERGCGQWCGGLRRHVVSTAVSRRVFEHCHTTKKRPPKPLSLPRPKKACDARGTG